MLGSPVGTPTNEAIVSRISAGGAGDWCCSDWGGEEQNTRSNEGDDDGKKNGGVRYGGVGERGDE